MIRIDIERLADVVDETNAAYRDYKLASLDLYKGDYSELSKRKEHLRHCDEYHDQKQAALWAVMEVLGLDGDQRKRLFIAARAVERWRIRTGWERLVPDNMKKQIERFVFGPPVAPSFVCRSCGCWEV